MTISVNGCLIQTCDKCGGMAISGCVRENKGPHSGYKRVAI